LRNSETDAADHYGDYADILLQKQEENAAGQAVIWIQTTWEGGRNPIKVAPTQRACSIHIRITCWPA
jgi:hypothetical protein